VSLGVYPAGHLIPCQGCEARRKATGQSSPGKVSPVVICGAPPNKTVLARTIPSPDHANPDWFQFYCAKCKTWTEYQATEVAA
jgi:hypothetical protein